MTLIADSIFELAMSLARRTAGFDARLGPGKLAGDGLTQGFLKELDAQVLRRWPRDVECQRAVAEGVGFSFDYYVGKEQTAIEIALGLRNPLSEFEKDLFKAILAKEGGLALRRLLLIGKSGARKRLGAPGPQAVMAWASQRCAITIEVRELDGRLTS